MMIGLIGAEGRLGKEIRSICPYPITSFTSKSPIDPQVPFDLLLDVSTADALENHLQIAETSNKPIVVGTTGNISMEILKEAAAKIPVFYSANFSLGMEIFRQAAISISKHFPKVQILETHHVKKKDTPSGTSLMLQKALAGAPISSIREGTCFGKHELYFDSDVEKLVLIHEAKNLQAFAKGAIVAAEFLAGQLPGLYTMEHLCKTFTYGISG